MNIPIHIQKFKQEMERRFMSKKTVKNYGSCATAYLTAFLQKEHPLHITDEEFKGWLFSAFEDQSTQRANHSAVKKFYEVVFNKERFRYIPYAQKKETQIIILSEEEMRSLLRAMTNLKHFCITLLFYSTGIRISELLNIRYATDIDVANGVIYVMGKGSKPRPVTMKPKLLEVIQAYISEYKPQNWLFENDQTHNKYSERSINEFLKYNARKAGITKRVHAHLLRHCYASHSILISGLYMVQEILGHSDPKITAGTYIHGSPKIISQAYSPIDSISLNYQERLLSPISLHISGKIYEVLLNGKTYLLKVKDKKIIEATANHGWTIGKESSVVFDWYKKKGYEIKETTLACYTQ